MCLDSAEYQRGITCRPLDLRGRGPDAPPPPAAASERATADRPRAARCPPYVAPLHGSAWLGGKEYRIATPDAHEHAVVTLTCDENFRLSDRGSRWPECLHDGAWDPGKTCEAIRCPAYEAPAHGSVDVRQPVRAGTRVTISCNAGYMAFGQDAGAHRTPRCLADSSYERGIECVPRPCSRAHKMPLPADEEPCDPEAAVEQAHPPAVVITRGQVREWEHGLQQGDAFDYAPNVFDHEPRPFQTPQVP